LFPLKLTYSFTSRGKQIIKFTLGLLDIVTGGRIRAKTLLGLVYHEVSDKPSEMSLDTKTFTSISTFQKQMGWVFRSYNVIDITELKTDYKRGDLVLSFDDGYRSFKYNALPLLSELEFSVICFINSSTINKQINASALVAFQSRFLQAQTFWENSNPAHHLENIKYLNTLEREDLESYQGEYLTWDDIQELNHFQLVKFGNHLQNHWYAPRLTSAELTESIKMNERETAHVVKLERILAWPHGASTKLLSSVASEAGMKIQMFGTNPVQVGEDTQVIPRVDMNQGISNYPIFRGSLLIARLKHTQKAKQTIY
jgi:peptidoglycan/xylan/chitin deacetylase (PgdA/CDA1 family)